MVRSKANCSEQNKCSTLAGSRSKKALGVAAGGTRNARFATGGCEFRKSGHSRWVTGARSGAEVATQRTQATKAAAAELSSDDDDNDGGAAGPSSPVSPVPPEEKRHNFSWDKTRDA